MPQQEDMIVTAEDKEFLDKINAYAEKVLGDIDPQKTHVSKQLEELRPIMQTLSIEYGIPTSPYNVRIRSFSGKEYPSFRYEGLAVYLITLTLITPSIFDI